VHRTPSRSTRTRLARPAVAVDPLADAITPLHADDDAHLDVFSSSIEVDHAAVLFGVGDGSLGLPMPRTLVGLSHTQAVDWSGQLQRQPRRGVRADRR